MADYSADIAIIKSELQQITGRVALLESGFMDMKTTLRHFEGVVKHADKTALEAKNAALEAAVASQQAVTLLSAATGIAGFVAKHGPRVISAIMGILVYKGIVSGEIGAGIGAIFGA